MNHDQRHETSRLKHTRTEENVTTADELADPLRQDGRPETNTSFNTPDI